MVALKTNVDKLLGHRDQFQELLAATKSLAIDAVSLRAKADDRRLIRKLVGRCKYI